MIKKTLSEIKAFQAGDHTWLREWLHPANGDIDLGFSIAHASLEVGQSSLPHILEKSVEVYLFMTSHGTIIVDEKSTKVKSGDLLVVPAGSRQYVHNEGDVKMEFVCIVSPPWNEAEEKVE